MAEIALGWLHWTETQLIETDMNAILVGHHGMSELLAAIYGRADKPAPGSPQQIHPDFSPISVPKSPEVPVIVSDTAKMPKLTPEAFDKMFSKVKGKPH